MNLRLLLFPFSSLALIGRTTGLPCTKPRVCSPDHHYVLRSRYPRWFPQHARLLRSYLQVRQGRWQLGIRADPYQSRRWFQGWYPLIAIARPYPFQTFDAATATKLAGEQPDYGIKALFETIEAGKYPSWTVYIVRTYTQ